MNLTRRAFIQMATAAVAVATAPALAASPAAESLTIRVIELAPMSDASEWMLIHESGGQTFVQRVRVPALTAFDDKVRSEEAAHQIARAARKLKADVYYARDPALWEKATQMPAHEAGCAYRLAAGDLSDVVFV